MTLHQPYKSQHKHITSPISLVGFYQKKKLQGGGGGQTNVSRIRRGGGGGEGGVVWN